MPQEDGVAAHGDQTDRLLRGFQITHVLDCIADATKNRVIARLSDDVSPVFPYVNAVLPGVLYNPEAQTLTIRRGVRLLTFYPRLAIFAKVDGEADAIAQLRWFQDLCNDLWRRRAELTPRLERQRLLGPLDVYKLLPRLNCQRCGERTCMAFAFSLLLGLRQFEACPHLAQEPYAEVGRRLAELLEAVGLRNPDAEPGLSPESGPEIDSP
ncbi:MAG: (Fe-S)-binding protein [Chloroflexia bacterium]